MGIAIAGSKNRCTFAAVIEKQTVANIDRDVAQLASAPRSGRGGRKFVSSHPDLGRQESEKVSAFFVSHNQGGTTMIVYNTTFHIHKEILAECLAFLKSHYIPQAAASGLLRDPYLRRILNSENEEGESYSVQFHTQDTASLNQWLQQDGRALQQELIDRYQEKIVGFSTLLEEIALGD